MEIKQRIEMAKANLKKAENAKTVAETQRAAAEGQLKETVEQMAAAGVTPETINGEIVTLEEKVNADLDKVERLIPVV
jgi:transcription elongation GreA/GreB family factor